MDCIVVEATGGYERAAVAELAGPACQWSSSTRAKSATTRAAKVFSPRPTASTRRCSPVSGETCVPSGRRPQGLSNFHSPTNRGRNLCDNIFNAERRSVHRHLCVCNLVVLGAARMNSRQLVSNSSQMLRNGNQRVNIGLGYPRTPALQFCHLQGSSDHIHVHLCRYRIHSSKPRRRHIVTPRRGLIPKVFNRRDCFLFLWPSFKFLVCYSWIHNPDQHNRFSST